MKFINWLWNDDKTGKFSDTTLRTWIAFFLFVGCTIYWVWFDHDGIQVNEEILVQTLMFFCIGQGTLFAAKRFNERKGVTNQIESSSPDENLRNRSL